MNKLSSSPVRRYQYKTCCVNSTANAIHDMTGQSREVTYRTFRKHCAGLDDWARGMSYELDSRYGLTLKNDFHVSYHRSVYRGKPCYYLVHSAIEYIWVKDEKG